MEEGWRTALSPVFDTPWFHGLTEFVRQEYRTPPVYPPGSRIFRAFDACPFGQVKVVILGQDPYHGPGQANGLCFSVNPEVREPPSLVNIFKELQDDLGRPPHADRTLEHWARQGVLLLNATLTVRGGQPMSHTGKGWEEFTDTALRTLTESRDHLVVILWGSHAWKKGAFVDPVRHCVIRSPHPSPLSAYRGFFGSRPFSRANQALAAWGKDPVDW